MLVLAMPLFYPAFLSLRILYLSSAMESVRERCSKPTREELVDAAQSTGGQYGAIAAVEGDELVDAAQSRGGQYGATAAVEG